MWADSPHACPYMCIPSWHIFLRVSTVSLAFMHAFRRSKVHQAISSWNCCSFSGQGPKKINSNPKYHSRKVHCVVLVCAPGLLCFEPLSWLAQFEKMLLLVLFPICPIWSHGSRNLVENVTIPGRSFLHKGNIHRSWRSWWSWNYHWRSPPLSIPQP